MQMIIGLQISDVQMTDVKAHRSQIEKPAHLKFAHLPIPNFPSEICTFAYLHI
jgi:hypothetical protein